MNENINAYLYITIIAFYVNMIGKELYKANEIICNNKL